MPEDQTQKPAWLHRLLSDVSGIPDEARLAALVMILTFCGNSVVSVVLSETHAFDMQAFGVGAGVLATGLGAWFGLRKDN